MLEGRDVLGPGLGLGAFKLFLLPTPVSREVLAVLDPEVNMLLGLEVLVFLVAVVAGLGFGGGWATTATAAGRTNMPLPMSQSKYRSPWTLPSFLPDPSSSSTPTQAPGAKAVSPTKRMTALRPSARRTTCPGTNSVIFDRRTVLVVCLLSSDDHFAEWALSSWSSLISKLLALTQLFTCVASPDRRECWLPSCSLGT